MSYFKHLWRCTAISELMINEQIRDREIRLVGENGEQLGIMSTREAMKIAQEAELDLVKIAPTAKPRFVKLSTMVSTVTNWPEKRKKQRKTEGHRGKGDPPFPKY